MPPRLHVFLTFMVQFISLLLAFGVGFPALRARGVPLAVLAVGSVGFVVALQVVIAVVGRQIPVRCAQCRSGSRYRGFGWWPFTYRYLCGRCGHHMRYDLVA